MERDKTSGYSFNTLFSTWQQTEEYNSEEENPCNEQEKVLIIQFMLQLLLNRFLLLFTISSLLNNM